MEYWAIQSFWNLTSCWMTTWNGCLSAYSASLDHSSVWLLTSPLSFVYPWPVCSPSPPPLAVNVKNYHRYYPALPTPTQTLIMELSISQEAIRQIPVMVALIVLMTYSGLWVLRWIVGSSRALFCNRLSLHKVSEIYKTKKWQFLLSINFLNSTIKHHWQMSHLWHVLCLYYLKS